MLNAVHSDLDMGFSQCREFKRKNQDYILFCTMSKVNENDKFYGRVFR